MKKLLYLFSVSLLALTSCTKDDIPVEPPVEIDPAANVLVKKVDFILHDAKMEITYDGHKIVNTEITDFDGKIKTNYLYTGNLITKIDKFDYEGNLAVTTEYSYVNEKLISSLRKELQYNTSYKINFTHQSDEIVSYIILEINNPENLETEFGRGKLTFKDGNLLENETSSSVFTYEYDTKNNPFKNFTGFQNILSFDALLRGGEDLLYVNTNNIIKKTEVKHTTSATATYVYTSNLLYDENGFPTEKKTYLNIDGQLRSQTKYTY